MIEDIEAGIDISAPIERVWRVLTGEGLVEQWLGCQQFKAELGHVFYMQPDAARRAANDITGAIHCQVERMEPPNRFVFTWYYPDQPKKTLVELTLQATPDGTRARLLHSGWGEFDEADVRAVRDTLVGGWTSYVLPNLRRLSETA
jgi:uncharacterized protein YndB with AHSA1/START domain